MIEIPQDSEGRYTIYTFDSLQCVMDDKTKRKFGLILWELGHIEDALTTGDFEQEELDTFMRTRTDFVRVKVC